jgi:hypothetical protein
MKYILILLLAITSAQASFDKNYIKGSLISSIDDFSLREIDRITSNINRDDIIFVSKHKTQLFDDGLVIKELCADAIRRAKDKAAQMCFDFAAKQSLQVSLCTEAITHVKNRLEFSTFMIRPFCTAESIYYFPQ